MHNLSQPERIQIDNNDKNKDTTNPNQSSRSLGRVCHRRSPRRRHANHDVQRSLGVGHGGGGGAGLAEGAAERDLPSQLTFSRSHEDDKL